MKTLKRRIASLLAAVLLLTGAFPAYGAGTWRQQGSAWYYDRADGTAAVGWLSLSSAEWYYLAAEGRMRRAVWIRGGVEPGGTEGQPSL